MNHFAVKKFVFAFTFIYFLCVYFIVWNATNLRKTASILDLFFSLQILRKSFPSFLLEKLWDSSWGENVSASSHSSDY